MCRALVHEWRSAGGRRRTLARGRDFCSPAPTRVERSVETRMAQKTVDRDVLGVLKSPSSRQNGHSPSAEQWPLTSVDGSSSSTRMVGSAKQRLNSSCGRQKPEHPEPPRLTNIAGKQRRADCKQRKPNSRKIDLAGLRWRSDGKNRLRSWRSQQFRGHRKH